MNQTLKNISLEISAALKSGLAYHQDGQLKEANAVYEKILEIDPNQPDALHLSGLIAHQLGEAEKAARLIKRAIDIDSSQPFYYNNLGNALKEKGDLQDAAKCYGQAIQLNPKYAEAYSNLGDLLQIQKNDEGAIHAYLMALEINPEMAETAFNLGHVYRRQRELEKAMFYFRKALQLNPRYFEAYSNLGSILHQTGKKREAIACFKQSLKLYPANPELLFRMGDIFVDLDALNEAVSCYQQVLEINPDYVMAYFHMGHAFHKQGNATAAMSCFRKVVDLDIEQVDIYRSVYIHLKQACDWDYTDALEEKFDRLNEEYKRKDGTIYEDPFTCMIRHTDPALGLDAAKTAIRHISASVSRFHQEFNFDGIKKPGERITVGYYSGNFWDHPNAHQIHSMFGCHNRTDFEIFCYSGGEDDGSPYYEKIKKECDTFVDISDMGDEEAARRIYHDKVDILVDLVGSIEGGRSELFALRPAPVQIRYLGMPGTSGADFYDYLITDRIVTPDADTPFYTEKFIHMPHCYQVNSIQLVSNRKRTRADYGLPEQSFIFCSFNTNYKFDKIMFHAWLQILRETPGSVLWLLSQNSAAETNLKTQAESFGVDSNRIIFTEKLPKPIHLARLELADLALDTRIVNGAASTSDVLRMGLPIITLEGAHFASRMSASILSAMGLPELIAQDLEAYKKLAVHLTRPDALNSIRNKLEKNKKTSPLFDTARFVRNLESAFKNVWNNFLAGKGPKPIDVVEKVNQTSCSASDQWDNDSAAVRGSTSGFEETGG